jgi:hypothetical protein
MKKEHIFYSFLGVIGAVSGLLLLSLVVLSVPFGDDRREFDQDDTMMVFNDDQDEEQNEERMGEPVVAEDASQWVTYEGLTRVPAFAYLTGWHVYIDQFAQGSAESRVWIDTEPIYFVDGEKFFPINIVTYQTSAFYGGQTIEEYVAYLAPTQEQAPQVEVLEDGKTYLVRGVDAFGGYKTEHIVHFGNEYTILVVLTDVGSITEEQWEMVKEQLDFSDVR